jgi:hypothetical protein
LEPFRDGYVFYPSPWSPGIPVSAEERDSYIKSPPGAARQNFESDVLARPRVLPRRPIGSFLTTTPRWFGLAALVMSYRVLFYPSLPDGPLSTLSNALGVGLAGIGFLLLVAGGGRRSGR